MAKRLVSLKIEHIAGVDRPANKRRFVVVKNEKTLPRGKNKEGVVMLTKEQIVSLEDEELQNAVLEQQEELLDAQNKLKEQDAELNKLRTAVPESDEEKFWKNENPAVRNLYEALKRRNEEIEKQAKDEKRRRDEEIWTEKGKKHRFLQVSPQGYGRIMTKISESCPNEAAEIEKILVVADEAIEKGDLFRELGKGGGVNGDATSITARVDALADEYMKRDSALTKDTAIQKVFSEHRDWYGPWRKESQQRI